MIPTASLTAVYDERALDISPTDLKACDHLEMVWHCQHTNAVIIITLVQS